jgi:hypothetical protein
MQQCHSLPVAVVTAISDVKDVDPDELDYSLQEYVDIGAVEQLASNSTTSWTVSFELPEHSATVRSDGVILVDGSKENTWK